VAQIEHDAPDFAARVRSRFEAGTNKTLATLRRDGAPRISASELPADHLVIESWHPDRRWQRRTRA
jgi:hypothetical protein